jgi:hypothetical protein
MEEEFTQRWGFGVDPVDDAILFVAEVVIDIEDLATAEVLLEAAPPEARAFESNDAIERLREAGWRLVAGMHFFGSGQGLVDGG